MRIFHTLSRQKETFSPLRKEEISFYQCGPTVYWTQHIGNMRAMVMGDIVRRALMYFGYNVSYVRNYTDVGHLVSDEDEGEDKMEKGAKREGLSPNEIANKYITQFERDVNALNILEPTRKPRATETIPEIIEMVKILIDKGYAYETPLAVYFDTGKAKNYSALSGQDLSKQESGAGLGRVKDTKKRNLQDFAVWFFKAGDHKNALQTWGSPFHSSLAPNGEGFPGWHIECSAMIKKFLGETIDIHMGGVEHISIHHTNEIAQSESANGKPFVNYWMHNEHLLIEGKKMAKSEGTGFTLDEITSKGFLPEDLRYFFLQAHYRSKQNFTWEALESASSGLKRIKNKITSLSYGKVDEILSKKFREALEDDFNTPAALAVLEESLKTSTLETVLDFDKVLGLGFDKIASESPAEIPTEVIALAKERELARKNKDWQKSDELRDKIEALGYSIRDNGTKYLVTKID